MPVMNRKHRLVAILILIQSFIGIAGGLVFASTPRENFIFPGVFIRGIEVGGLPGEQATRILEQELAPKLKEEKVILQYKDKTWEFTCEQLGVMFDIPATILNAERIGRGGSMVESLVMFQVRYRKPNVPLEFKLDEPKLDRALSQLAREIQVPVENAEISLNGGRIQIIPGVTGKVFDLEENEKRIRQALGADQPMPVELAVSEITPRLTATDLEAIKDLLGVGVTTFSRSDKEKVRIIFDAVKTLNGRVLKPGEIFSFNQAVGPSISENKYNQARLNSAKRLSESHSGGAVQVATTLYQAVLYSGLKIIERNAHLVPPVYVKLGQDAAVASGLLDLRFENNTKNSVYISAVNTGSRIVVNIFGVKENGQTIQVTTRETLTKQPELTGPNGSHARVFRIYYNKGVEVKRETISDDDYI